MNPQYALPTLLLLPLACGAGLRAPIQDKRGSAETARRAVQFFLGKEFSVELPQPLFPIVREKDDLVSPDGKTTLYSEQVADDTGHAFALAPYELFLRREEGAENGYVLGATYRWHGVSADFQLEYFRKAEIRYTVVPVG